MSIKIPIANLDCVNPYKHTVWLGLRKPITIKEVAKAIDSGKFTPKPLPDQPDRQITRKEHITRIAYLVVHGWEDPIHLDVGVPSLLCYVDWPLVDDNHRMAAAIYREDHDILAEVSGQVSYAEELFGIKL